jgi:soluble cytochrome b562
MYIHKRLTPLAIIVLLSSILIISPKVSALTLEAQRDCDANAVIYCGALTPNELKTKYNDSASAKTIYHNFGITHVDIDDMSKYAVEGKVTEGGRVVVNGEEVATNAITAGRQNMEGSQAATANGVTFYKRSPSVSFQSSSLPAFVVIKDGQFKYAVIGSCGNPVMATPVVRPKPAPAAAVSPTPTPPPRATQTVVVTQNVPVPSPAPAPVPVAQHPQPKQIPNTGVGDVVGFGSFVTLLSGAIHLASKRWLFS